MIRDKSKGVASGVAISHMESIFVALLRTIAFHLQTSKGLLVTWAKTTNIWNQLGLVFLLVGNNLLRSLGIRSPILPSFWADVWSPNHTSSSIFETTSFRISLTLPLAKGPPFCTWRTVRKRGCKGKPLLRPKEYMRSMSTDSGPFSGKKKLDASLDTDGYGIWMDVASGFRWIT